MLTFYSVHFWDCNNFCILAIIQKLKNLLFKMVKFAVILCNGGTHEQKMNL